MPKPLLTIPKVFPKPKFKVGDLVLRRWSNAKSVHNRVVKVISVLQTGFIIRVTTRAIDGSGETATESFYETFEEYRDRVKKSLDVNNRTLTKQYKELEMIDTLEKKARAAFDSLQ